MIGNVHRSLNLLCVFLVLQRPIPVLTQVPPGSPVITGPDIIMMGDIVTLTCTVHGGSPLPTVKWFVNDAVIDDTSTYTGGTTHNSYTFTAVEADHHKVFECQTANGVLQNPLSRTQFIRVYRSPNPPTLTGPTTITTGTLSKWTCISEEGYPAQNMSMRLGSASFGKGFTTNTRLVGLKSYTVIGILYWAPSTLNDNHMLYCDVYHKETLGSNNAQTVGLLLSVKSNFTIKTPRLIYEPITGQSATLVVAVIIGKATKVSWYKNNNLIDTASNSRYSGGNYQTPSLTINRVELDDAGSYMASVTEDRDKRNTSIITVSPKATPAQPTLTGPTSLTAGTTGSWTCISHGAFPLQTMSMRIGNQIFGSSDMSIYSQYEPAVMSFRVVGMLSWTPYINHDGQTLFCDVTHPETLNNPQTVSLQLTVRTPLSMTTPKTSYNTEVTNKVTLAVDIKGNPTEIRWYKNAELLITTSNKYSGGTSFVPGLTIKNISMSDAGIYVCEATDGTDTVRSSIIQLSAKIPLSVRTTKTFYNTTETRTATLNVVISGTPTNIFWFKNNDLVVTSGRFSGGTISTPALTIQNVSMSDAGRYVLEATDGTVTVKTRPIFLSPIAQLEVTARKRLYEPTIGESITLYVDVTSSNIKDVRWYKDNKQIYVDSDSRLFGGNPQTVSLNIKSVKLSDAGNYSCSVTDGFVIRNTSYITVSPKASPEIPTLSGPTSLTAGTTGTWTCISVGGFPLQSLSMRIGDQVFNTNELVTFSQHDIVHKSYTVIGILTWTPKLSHDGQQISCDIKHPETSISPQTVGLQLTVEPSLTAIASKVLYSQTESSIVTLDVKVKGNPNRVNWYHNGNLIVLSGRFSGGTVSVPSLTITNVSTSDAGRYVFEATDGDTTVQTITIILTVRALLAVRATKTLYEPVVGESVVLGVEVNSVNVTGVRWFKNKQEINIASNSRLSGGNTRYPSLNIQNVLLTDAGNYVSSVTDGVDIRNTSTIVLAPKATPVIPTLTGPTSLTADTFGTWTCTSVGGFPLQTMTMRIGGQVFDNQQLLVNSQYDSDSMSFRVVGVLLWAPNIRDDGQTLYCDVTHTQTLSRSQSTSLRLTVTRPLLARVSTVIYSPLEATTVTLNVVLQGTPTIINWYKNGQLITISGRYSGGNVSFPALVIRDVSIIDAGSYVCEVTDGKTTLRTSTIQLSIKTKPPVTTPRTVVSKLKVKASKTFYNPKQSTSVTLRVQIDGTPSQVVWYQNGQLIIKSGRHSGGTVTVPSLTINNVTRSDAGSYVCEATNEMGTFRTAIIQVSPTVTPQQPSLSGPTTVTEGIFGTWTCISIGGVPLYKMVMRIDDQVFSSKHLLINSQFDPSSLSYRITGILIWAPDISHDGQTLYCDILPPTQPIRRKRSNSQIASITLTVKPALLVIAGKMFYNTEETKSVTLQVNIEGTPTEIRWYKDNQLITISNRYSGGNVTVPALTIRNIKLSDGGIFVCEVINEKYTARSSEIKLTPTPILIVKAGKTLYNPKETESITLNVNVVGTPSQIRWYKNNLLITITNRYSGGSVSVPALTITNVQLSDVGEYVCEITNGKDTARTSMIQLSPISILSVVAGVTVYEPMESESVTLNVNVVGTPSQIKWYKNDQLITITNRYSGGNVSVPALTLSNVKVTDGGDYICEITNGKDTVRTRIIQLSPLSALSVLAGKTFYNPHETESVTLNVKVDGKPSRIRWYKNNQLINMSNRYSGGNVSVPALTITNIELNDGGEFVCEITNGKYTARTNIIQLSPSSVLSVTAGKTLYTPKETKTVKLKVKVVGNPSHVTWYKNKRPITITNRYSGGNVAAPDLIITNVELSDGGEYVCEITNGKETTQTSIIQLSPRSMLKVIAGDTLYTPKETESVTLNVKVIGTPSQIRWYKNDQLVKILGRYSGGNVTDAALTITNVKHSDGGEYVCEVIDGKDTAKTTKIRLFPSSNLSIVVGKIFYNPKETDTVTLNVKVVGIPSKIRWYKNNQLITILNRYAGGSVSAPALTITDVRLSDGGEYVCEVTKGKDTIQSSTIQLSPISMLSVIAEKIYYNPRETELVTLKVNVEGKPSKVTWYKNNQPITIMNRYAGGTVAAPALTITNIHLSDGGEYVCEVTNGKDTARSGTMQLSPATMLSVIAGKTLYNPQETQSVTLQVTVVGTPSKINWYKDNQLITLSDRYTDGTVSVPALTITNVKLSDVGAYVCEITNGKDTARTSIIKLSPLSILSVKAVNTLYSPKKKETVTLQVIVVGKPSKISWYKDDQLITISNRYSDGTVSSPSLTITNVKLSDGGAYVCEITNGKDTARTIIIQLSPMPLLSVVAKKTLYMLKQDATVTLKVKIVGKPSQITWYKDKQPIIRSDKYSGGDVSVPALTISKVAKSDVGDYVCEATDGTVTVNTKTISLSLTPMLAVIAIKTLYNPKEKESVTLRVTVLGTPSRISWYKDDQLITISNRYSDGTVSSPALTITNVQLGDGGAYVCEITNGIDTARTRIIQLSPLSLLSVVAIKTVYMLKQDATVTLGVKVIGKPSQITWYKDKQPLTRSDKYSGGDVSVPALTIRKVVKSDVGDYVCEAKDGTVTVNTNPIYLSLTSSTEEFKIFPTDVLPPIQPVQPTIQPVQPPIQPSVQPLTVVTRAPTTILLTTELPSTKPSSKFPATTADVSKPDLTIAPQTNSPRPNTSPPNSNSGSSSVSIDSQCHFHDGRPCCKQQNHGPVVNVNVNVRVDGKGRDGSSSGESSFYDSHHDSSQGDSSRHHDSSQSDSSRDHDSSQSDSSRIDSSLDDRSIDDSSHQDSSHHDSSHSDSSQSDSSRIDSSQDDSSIDDSSHHDSSNSDNSLDDSSSSDSSIDDSGHVNSSLDNSSIDDSSISDSSGSRHHDSSQSDSSHHHDSSQSDSSRHHDSSQSDSSRIDSSLDDRSIDDSSHQDSSHHDSSHSDSSQSDSSQSDSSLDDGSINDTSHQNGSLDDTIIDDSSLGGSSLVGRVCNGSSIDKTSLTDSSLVDTSIYERSLGNISLCDNNVSATTKAIVLSVTPIRKLYMPRLTKSVTLKVNVVGKTSRVTWYKNNEPLTMINRYSGGNTATPDLTLTNVELSDGGEYVCEIENGNETTRTSIIRVSPRSLPIVAVKVLYIKKETQSVTLRVTVVGTLSMVNWYKDNQLITLSDRYSGGTVSSPSLTITNLKQSDGGLYVCEITIGTKIFRTTIIKLIPASPFNCDFDTDFCGWNQDNNTDNFDWKRYRGPTTSPSTGPAVDHTTRTKRGYYTLMEASDKQPDDKARLISPIIAGNVHQCVTFFYHMHGNDINALNVYLSTVDTSNVSSPIWFRKGKQGNRWKMGQFEIPGDETTKSVTNVVVEGVRGPDYSGDIAIDDIFLTSGSCKQVFRKQSSVQPPVLNTQAPKEELKIFPTDLSLSTQLSDQPPALVTRAPTTILLTTESRSRTTTSKSLVTTTEFPKPDVSIAPQTSSPRPNTTPSIPTSHITRNGEISKMSESKLYTTTKQPAGSTVYLTTEQPYNGKLLNILLNSTDVEKRRKRSAQNNDFSCYSCDDLPYGETCTNINRCHSGHGHCMTQYNFHKNELMSTTTRCSHMHICMNREENNADECYWDNKGKFEGSCTYCCSENQCNTVVSSLQDNKCDNKDSKGKCDKINSTRSTTINNSKSPIAASRNKRDLPSIQPPMYKSKSRGMKSNERFGDKSENQLSTNNVKKTMKSGEIEPIKSRVKKATNRRKKKKNKGDGSKKEGGKLKRKQNGDDTKKTDGKSKGKQNGDDSKNTGDISNGIQRGNDSIKGNGKSNVKLKGHKSQNPKSGSKSQNHISGSKSQNPRLPNLRYGHKSENTSLDRESENPISGSNSQTESQSDSISSEQKSGRRSSGSSSGRKFTRKHKSQNPRKSGGSSSGQGDSSSTEYHRNRHSCHFHKGRPCCKKHKRPGVDVDVHVHVDTGLKSLGACPGCNNKDEKLGKQVKTTVTKSL
ncbi:titin-like [Mytilus trossulus]|uniref:titin-like n=1 Tax=Mytilus trossulus TaxID=6551 RepID=UPI0030043AFF